MVEGGGVGGIWGTQLVVRSNNVWRPCLENSHLQLRNNLITFPDYFIIALFDHYCITCCFHDTLTKWEVQHNTKDVKEMVGGAVG